MIDFETAMSRARDQPAADRARLAWALAHNSKATVSGASSARRRIGGGERIGGAERATGPARVAACAKARCA